jgi:hypothetical protein
MGGRGKTKRKWIIMDMCDDAGMSSRSLAFESPLAVSYIVLFLLLPYLIFPLYRTDDHLVVLLALTSILHILDRLLRRSSHNPQP